MIASLKRWFRDLWRGYTDAELDSVRAKVLLTKSPGEIEVYSSGEFAAFKDMQNWINQMRPSI